MKFHHTFSSLLIIVAVVVGILSLGTYSRAWAQTAPTATLTASVGCTTNSCITNGSHSITVNPGDMITYAYSGTGNGVATSSYTIDSPDNCSPGTSASTGPFPWILNGHIEYPSPFNPDQSTAQVQACQAGRTYTITYKIIDPTSGQSSSDSVVVKVGTTVAHNISVTFSPTTVAPFTQKICPSPGSTPYIVAVLTFLLGPDRGGLSLQLTDTATGSSLPPGAYTLGLALPGGSSYNTSLTVFISPQGQSTPITSGAYSVPGVGSYKVVSVTPFYFTTLDGRYTSSTSSGGYTLNQQYLANSNTLTVVPSFPPAYQINISPNAFVAGQAVPAKSVSVSVTDAKTSQPAPDGYYNLGWVGQDARGCAAGGFDSFNISVKGGVAQAHGTQVGTPDNPVEVINPNAAGTVTVAYATLLNPANPNLPFTASNYTQATVPASSNAITITQPVVTPTPTTINIVPASGLSISPSTLTFVSGSSLPSQSQSFTVTNNSASSVSWVSGSVPGGVSAAFSPSQGTLAPGASQPVTLTILAPSPTGTYNIQILNNSLPTTSTLPLATSTYYYEYFVYDPAATSASCASLSTQHSNVVGVTMNQTFSSPTAITSYEIAPPNVSQPFVLQAAQVATSSAFLKWIPSDDPNKNVYTVCRGISQNDLRALDTFNAYGYQADRMERGVVCSGSATCWVNYWDKTAALAGAGGGGGGSGGGGSGGGGTPPDLRARQAATLQRIDRRIGALEDTKAALSEASGIPDALESQLSQLIDSLIQDLTTLRDRVSAAQSREEITIANRIVVTITTIQLNIRQLIRNLERLQTLLTQ